MNRVSYYTGCVLKQLFLFLVSVFFGLLAVYTVHRGDVGLCVLCPVAELWYVLVLAYAAMRFILGLLMKEPMNRILFYIIFLPFIIGLVLSVWELFE